MSRGWLCRGTKRFQEYSRAERIRSRFWLGLWHGFILPFAFIVSLFNHKVTIYEVHNAGTWYNLRHLFGTAMI
jgi:hypothetical protein